MKILGIGDSHDSGVTLIEDGKVIYAVNQERLDRIKLSSGFPVDCLDYIENKITPLKDIDVIVLAGEYGPFIEPHTNLSILQTAQDSSKERSLLSKTQNYFAPLYRSSLGTFGIKKALKYMFKERPEKIKELLKARGYEKEILFVDHHLCHAASAVFTCPEETFHRKSLVITADGAGDGLSGSVYIAQNGELKKLHEINQFNSLAFLYSYVTQICGFTPMKHEGKITGLAAYGKPTYLEVFKKMIRYKNGSFYNICGKQHQAAIDFIKKEIGENFDKADLSASIQVFIESEFTKFVNYWVQKTGVRDILLAGGLFANVKLNQKLHEQPMVNSIFVHQNMGDGGIGFGAAVLTSFEKTGNYVAPEKHVYFGQEFSDLEIESALKKYKISYRKSKTIERDVAILLSTGKVIARVNGRMEYGPRALGNRTILYQTNDKKVNDWLNKRLKRTEFMPFAPVTLIEEADRCYTNMKGAEYTARFMTITFNCTDFMKKRSPAVVHVDGTARPQLIDKETNPSYRKILEEYYEITGIPSLINTSFNMHEEPIVTTPEDSIRSFLQGNIDYLAIGNYLVKNSKSIKN